MTVAAIRMDKRTYTITSEGYVPSYTYKGIHCPVKVVTDKRNANDYPIPVRTLDNKYVYALPGGLSITPDHPQAPVIEFAPKEFNGTYRRTLR